MTWQSGQILEEQLVARIQKLNYTLALIKDEKELLHKLKQQLKKHNTILFSEK